MCTVDDNESSQTWTGTVLRLARGTGTASTRASRCDCGGRPLTRAILFVALIVACRSHQKLARARDNFLTTLPRMPMQSLSVW